MDIKDYTSDKIKALLQTNTRLNEQVKHLTKQNESQLELIGYGEGVTDEEILLLKAAALFHDIGHTISSPGHE